MAVEQTELADFLAFWHPILDEEIDEDYLDWGPVAPGSSDDRPVRVRNCSPALWAVEVTLSCVEQDQPVMSVAGQHLLSTDGDLFTATAALGDLPPQTVSGTVTLRRVTDPGADVGAANFQLVAAATDWR